MPTPRRAVEVFQPDAAPNLGVLNLSMPVVDGGGLRAAQESAPMFYEHDLMIPPRRPTEGPRRQPSDAGEYRQEAASRTRPSELLPNPPDHRLCQGLLIPRRGNAGLASR